MPYKYRLTATYGDAGSCFTDYPTFIDAFNSMLYVMSLSPRLQPKMNIERISVEDTVIV